MLLPLAPVYLGLSLVRGVAGVSVGGRVLGVARLSVISDLGQES